MRTRSRALCEWREEARRARQRLEVEKRRGVVHHVHASEPVRSRQDRRRGAQVSRGGVKKFLVLAVMLLVCLAWLWSLLASFR